MKKLALIAVVVILAVSFSGIALAGGDKDCEMGRQCKSMFGNMFGPKDKGMEMGRCMCPMHKMMVRRVMDREIIATYDGGIAVVLGNKITKYDKDMNLIKEVEIKIDMDVMKKSMEEMKRNCPMCSKMQDKK